jgi:cell division protein FtsL
MEITPDTSSYMIAGFVVSFVTMGIYVVSLYIRSRNLKQDIETLESMQNEKPTKNKLK